jgi:hypothetical protein
MLELLYFMKVQFATWQKIFLGKDKVVPMLKHIIEIRGCIQKSPDWVDNEINSKFTEKKHKGLWLQNSLDWHKIAIQLHLVAESYTVCSSRSRRLVWKLFDTPSYMLGRVWGRVPLIHNIRGRWKWVISFTLRPLYFWTNRPRHTFAKRLGKPQSRSGRGGKEKYPNGESNSIRPTRSKSLYFRVTYNKIIHILTVFV